MNYKEILTEAAVEGFRKEGATFVVLSLFNDKDIIRDLEIRLEDELEFFAISGLTSAAQAALARDFTGAPETDGRIWYPFQTFYVMMGRNVDETLKKVAEYAKVNTTELAWMFINEH